MQESTIIITDEANLKASSITTFTSFIIQILTWSVKNEVCVRLPFLEKQCPAQTCKNIIFFVVKVFFASHH